jgi:exodeoxyribonuclease V alpha subunit
MGFLQSVEHGESRFTVNYDGREVEYAFDDADQLVPAYAVTVHKSQGCEFPAVIMPMLSQHYMMLQRNLLYTGITRAKKLMILVGSYKAVSMAVRNAVRTPRYSLLLDKLKREVSL